MTQGDKDLQEPAPTCMLQDLAASLCQRNWAEHTHSTLYLGSVWHLGKVTIAWWPVVPLSIL